MTVIQLECFMEVCKQKSFYKAAANLFLSQPTLSRHIQALEGDLRASLFTRTNSAIHLTPIGQALYPTLERLHQQIRDASTEMHEIVDRYAGLFCIGIAAGLQMQDEYRRAIRDIRIAHPDIRIQLRHLNMSEINSALMSGAVDVLFSMADVVPSSDKIHKQRLYVENMRLAVPADHPNADLTSVEQSEIKTYFPDLEVRLLDAGTFDPSLQGELKSILDDYDGSEDLVKVPASAFDVEDIMLTVEAGLGVTCVNESGVLQNNPRVSLIPLVDVLPDALEYKTTEIAAYWIDKNYNPLLKAFLDVLKREYEGT